MGAMAFVSGAVSGVRLVAGLVDVKASDRRGEWKKMCCAAAAPLRNL